MWLTRVSLSLSLLHTGLTKRDIANLCAELQTYVALLKLCIDLRKHYIMYTCMYVH